jgi:hypothetical protein
LQFLQAAGPTSKCTLHIIVSIPQRRPIYPGRPDTLHTHSIIHMWCPHLRGYTTPASNCSSSCKPCSAAFLQAAGPTLKCTLPSALHMTWCRSWKPRYTYGPTCSCKTPSRAHLFVATATSKLQPNELLTPVAVSSLAYRMNAVHHINCSARKHASNPCCDPCSCCRTSHVFK